MADNGLSIETKEISVRDIRKQFEEKIRKNSNDSRRGSRRASKEQIDQPKVGGGGEGTISKEKSSVSSIIQQFQQKIKNNQTSNPKSSKPVEAKPKVGRPPKDFIMNVVDQKLGKINHQQQEDHDRGRGRSVVKSQEEISSEQPSEPEISKDEIISDSIDQQNSEEDQQQSVPVKLENVINTIVLNAHDPNKYSKSDLPPQELNLKITGRSDPSTSKQLKDGTGFKIVDSLPSQKFAGSTDQGEMIKIKEVPSAESGPKKLQGLVLKGDRLIRSSKTSIDKENLAPQNQKYSLAGDQELGSNSFELQNLPLSLSQSIELPSQREKNPARNEPQSFCSIPVNANDLSVLNDPDSVPRVMKTTCCDRIARVLTSSKDCLLGLVGAKPQKKQYSDLMPKKHQQEVRIA